MNILFVLLHNRFTGVNVWAYTLAKYLIEKGYAVTFCIRPDPNMINYYREEYTDYTEYCKQASIKVILPTEELDCDVFNVAIINYLYHAQVLVHARIKKVFVAHSNQMANGVGYYRFDACVGVSQYVCDIYGLNECIPNGIDFDLFVHDKYAPFNANITGLFLTRYRTEYTDKFIELLDTVGMRMKFVGDDHTQQEIVKLIQESDFVVGVGRSAYEGMACGKPVFISTGKTSCGWVNEDSFWEMFYYNLAYSDAKVLNDSLVLDEIMKYTINTELKNREVAKEYVSSIDTGDKYIKLLSRL